MPDARLSDAQRRIILHPADAGHLLVLAGPGAGKTRTIVERIHHLLQRGLCEAEHILAMTFTLQAAAELGDRLALTGHAGVAAGTFHHVCARLLTDHGSAIGVTPPLRILDEARQRELLHVATSAIGVVCDDRGPLSIRTLLAAIRRRKLAGLAPGEGTYSDLQTRIVDTIRAIDEAYSRLQRERDALDFDDLLARGIELVRTDHDTAIAVRTRYRYLFLDEFHDLSRDQFALIQEIAPPVRPAAHPDGRGVRPYAQVMAVADPNQSIFGFRAADPAQIIPEFRRLYRPMHFDLTENFRSTATIVRAASSLLDPGSGGPALVATRDTGHPLSCIACDDEAHEASTLAAQISSALRSGNYAYDDIAVLYRTHTRANVAEAALLAAGIPIRRIQPERFFDQPDVQESLRYLDLIATLNDDDVAPALNWPRVLVDEPTMIHLRRLARADGRTLAELAQDVDTLAEAVTPLTRTVIADFVTGVAADLRPFAHGPLPDLIDRLLHLLFRRRSPIPTADRDSLRGFLAFLTSRLAPTLTILTDAVSSGIPIAIRHAGDPDTTAAAVILEHTLTHYLRHPVTVDQAGDPAQSGALTVDLTSPSPSSPVPTLTLIPLETRDRTYPVALLAWRLGQMLLTSFETLDQGRFTIYDLETGSHHANSTEILELAALRINRSAPTGDSFSSFVRPRSPASITYDAEQIHGIGWRDVATAPSAAEILPTFLAFLGTDILVGHNVDDFDGRILRRQCLALDLPTPAEETIDTAKLARRLLPDQSHALEALAHEFGVLNPGDRQPHRALPDCEVIASVFSHLLARSRAERELDTLDETLPLVALAILRTADHRDELATLVQAGARGLSLGQGATLVGRWRNLQSDPIAAVETVTDLRDRDTASPADDTHWSEFAHRWRDTVATYLATGNDPTLAAFLNYVRLATSIDETAAAPGRVTLMSIHSAKGKEWPLVFVIGTEDGSLPLWSETTEAGLAEERRVLYVALTRAENQVRLLWARNTHNRPRNRSRFLEALPPNLLRHRTADPEGPSRAAEGSDQ